MEAALKLSKSKNFFKTIEKQFGGEFHQKFGEYVMNLNNLKVKGAVKAIEIRKNEFFFEFNIISKQQFSIGFPPKNYNAVNFLYCQKGNLGQSFGDSNIINPLNEFQTAIVAHKTEDIKLSFRANTATRFILISICNIIDTPPSPMIAKVHSLFSEKMKNNKFAYFGSINLKISSQINALNDITETGIVRKLLIEGTVQLILGMEIQHHKKDIENKTLHASSLTRRELSTIQELGEHIKNNVAEPYSIDMLMDQTGISAAKLQEGFKLLYNRTVTDYIKNLRVEESERLIKNTDLNVSQIVYTIGFSSRSYFSKIFRKKYGCSPNEYLNKCRVTVAI
ncbi:helix-turn-helix domain-containing protein [Aquimarina agarivorans]|uniref:helix-turn-helix domain-containing protein n=1 Tax=Aquimarina agarivorans TaxID=980584 RepID=UPI000248EC5C|nr:AraC family transcriptional regulator [Aquimarina agarivorans]